MEKKVIVIDDEEAIRKSFSLSLEDAGYAVETAATCNEGLEKIRCDGFDMVLLGLKTNGTESVKTLKEIRLVYEEVPVYVITAFYQEFLDYLQSAVKESIDFELVMKPLESKDLCSVIEGVIG